MAARAIAAQEPCPMVAAPLPLKVVGAALSLELLAELVPDAVFDAADVPDGVMMVPKPLVDEAPTLPQGYVST